MVTSSSVFVTAELGARVCVTGLLLHDGVGDRTQSGGQLSDVLLRWGAPELLSHGATSLPTAASGVWSFGVLMWELFQEEPDTTVPYGDLTTDELRTAAASNGGRPALLAPSTLSELCKTVFAACQIRSPPARPSMNGVATLLVDELGGADWWELPRSDLTFIERLGSGQFGDVNKMAARLLPTTPAGSSDSFVAVKTLKLANSTVDKAEAAVVVVDAAAENEFLQEAEVMKALRHPNLVKLVGLCTKEQPLWIVLEYLPGGSLDVWLPKCGKLAHSFQLLAILHQTARGMAALGAAGIIHRDLAARNVLIGALRCPLFLPACAIWGVEVLLFQCIDVIMAVLDRLDDVII